jgi:CheY-like chemotaxis protein
VALSVSDTGIGIEPEKQRIIFEAFQQADGGTSRRYGGTGLGLAISREISRLLGGELKLESTPGEGSTFTLYVPVQPLALAEAPVLRPGGALSVVTVPAAAPPPVSDDRAQLLPGDRVLLVVEDDPAFASLLADQGHERGFKVVVSTRGTDALASARELRPDAITFDVGLPDLDGWRVLHQLKDDPATRHIPMYLISAADDLERSLRSGAVGYLAKPVEKPQLVAAFSRISEVLEKRVKRLLVVESDEDRRRQILELVGNGDVETTAVASWQEGLQALSSQNFDCSVFGPEGWDDGGGGAQVAKQLAQRPELRTMPVIVYERAEAPRLDETQLRRLAPSMLLKSVRSPERLLDETALHLHRDAARLRDDQRRMLESLRSGTNVLADRTVLIVDDDVRNTFAMTSLLERHRMRVIAAENGKEALERLQATRDVAVVLMDVMLPGMDGYETTRAIRRLPEYRSLPIVALTAKAMRGDREKCIEAGASDYVAKPVEAEHLLGLLRAWVHH